MSEDGDRRDDRSRAVPVLRQPAEVPGVRQHLQREGGRRRSARRRSSDALRPRPPALRIFDAGMGDATVLSRLMRAVHRDFPTVPLLAVGEGDQPRGRAARAREDARPLLRAPAHGARDHEPELQGRAEADAAPIPEKAAALNWQEVRLTGTSSAEFEEQIEALGPSLAYGWETKPHPDDRQPDVRASVGPRALPRGPRVPARRRHPHARPVRRALRLHPRLAAVARAHVARVQGARRSSRRSRAASRRAGGC